MNPRKREQIKGQLWHQAGQELARQHRSRFKRPKDATFIDRRLISDLWEGLQGRLQSELEFGVRSQLRKLTVATKTVYQPVPFPTKTIYRLKIYQPVPLNPDAEPEPGFVSDF